MPVWHEMHGTLRLPPGLPSVDIGRLVFRVLDVSIADAPAVVVVERVRQQVTITDGEPFELRLPADDMDQALAAGRTLIVQVHGDRDGDGELTNGDLLTTQSHPITGLGEPVSITLTAI